MKKYLALSAAIIVILISTSCRKKVYTCDCEITSSNSSDVDYYSINVHGGIVEWTPLGISTNLDRYQREKKKVVKAYCATTEYTQTDNGVVTVYTKTCSKPYRY